MNRKREVIDELIESSKSIDALYFVDDGLLEAFDRFETWIEQVAQALKAANMAEELEEWRGADDTRLFSPGGSFSSEINEANFRNDVRAMRAVLVGLRDRLERDEPAGELFPTLRRQLQEPSRWRDALEQETELKKRILEEDHEEGTVGAFLKEAALSDSPPDALPDPEPDVEDLPKDLDVEPDGTDYLKRLCHRPIIAILVAIGAAIIAIGAFTDALQRIGEFFSQCIKAVF